MVIAFVLLAISMLLYFTAMGWGLPSLFLRTTYEPVQLHARGMRRCLFNGRPCVVYERSLNWRRHISRYLLYQSEGCKLLKCQVTAAVRYLEYDVVLFNRYNRIFDVIRVKEKLTSSYTRLLTLPDETAYVALRPCRVNKSHIPYKPIAHIPRLRVVFFTISAFLVTLFEGVMIVICSTYALGGVHREDFLLSEEHILISLIVAAAVALLGSLVVLVGLHRHRKV